MTPTVRTLKWPALALLGVATFAFVHSLPAREDPVQDSIRAANQLSLAFESASDRVQHAVVSINSTMKAQLTNLGRENPFRGSPFEQFFSQIPEGREIPRIGMGSGFVIDHDGHIVTNNHVVNGASEIEVTLSDDRKFKATVVGTDAGADVAVLKIDAKDLQPVELADSDSLRVGQWVIACGNPFGLSSTITAGIVSAKGRNRVGLADYEDFIQTDAAINPGNSGGPLVDLEGRVVGINSAIYTRSGGNMGIGFAIPISLAKPVIQGLLKDGKVSRGWLGVSIGDLTPELAKSFGYSGPGIVIADVTTSGPAEEAGIQPDDILVKLNGEAMGDRNRLRNTVAAMTPGQEVEVELWRDGKDYTVNVKLGTLPEDVEQRAMKRGGNGNNGRAQSDQRLGITVRDVTPQLAEQFGVGEDVHGALIVEVDPASPAATAGLQQGDVIVKVDRDKIDGAKAFKDAVQQRNLSEGIRLAVRRGDERMVVFLQAAR